MQRSGEVDGRGRDVLQDGLEQRAHVLALVVRVDEGVAVEGGGVDHRKIELFFGGPEFVEKVEGMVDDPVRARTGAVDLVDDDDGP